MASGKKRNPLNLSLPPTVKEEGVNGSAELQDTTQLQNQLQSLSLSQPQVQRMNEWKSQKRLVCYCFFNYVFFFILDW